MHQEVRQQHDEVARVAGVQDGGQPQPGALGVAGAGGEVKGGALGVEVVAAVVRVEEEEHRCQGHRCCYGCCYHGSGSLDEDCDALPLPNPARRHKAMSGRLCKIVAYQL